MRFVAFAGVTREVSGYKALVMQPHPEKIRVLVVHPHIEVMRREIYFERKNNAKL
jgi:hypothetical protein